MMGAHKGKSKKRAAREGSETMFPGRLYDLLEYVESQELDYIVSWVRNGTAVLVRKPDELLKLLSFFFGQTIYRSFTRRLNMWHFERENLGPFKGAFSHPCFVQGKRELCAQMSRHEPTAKRFCSSSDPMHVNLSNSTPIMLNSSIKHFDIANSKLMPQGQFDIIGTSKASCCASSVPSSQHHHHDHRQDHYTSSPSIHAIGLSGAIDPIVLTRRTSLPRSSNMFPQKSIPRYSVEDDLRSPTHSQLIGSFVSSSLLVPLHEQLEPTPIKETHGNSRQSFPPTGDLLDYATQQMNDPGSPKLIDSLFNELRGGEGASTSSSPQSLLRWVDLFYE